MGAVVTVAELTAGRLDMRWDLQLPGVDGLWLTGCDLHSQANEPIWVARHTAWCTVGGTVGCAAWSAAGSGGRGGVGLGLAGDLSA